jgi:peptidoglycan/xylan/chitin deacetylase (PgdA/CDA1 family)
MNAISEPALTGDVLSTTIGRLADDPEAKPLEAGDRADMTRWRDQRWKELERRAGSLATRDPTRWYETIAFERWKNSAETGGLPPVALELFYRTKRLIPRRAQLALRRKLIKRQGTPLFPEWPFEVAGYDLLRLAILDALLDRNVDAIRFPWFWPEGARAAIALTHDVESEQGIAGALTVAAWEEQHGFRSSFNIVSDWYPIDTNRVSALSERGHEIGSHAIHHDRSLFSSRQEFARQLPLLRESADRLGAVGFRSPATHRVVDWLAELPFSYDCTMPHSDPYEPIPGGTGTVWPFFHGKVVELPYTAPQDHTLFNLLGHRDGALWQRQLTRIVECAGLFQLITHPDADYLGRPLIARAYRELLEAISRRGDIWVALPRDIAEWWRRRANDLAPQENGMARWTGSEIEIAPATDHGAS